MRRVSIAGSFFVVALLIPSGSTNSAAAEDTAWVTLFGGKDTSDWDKPSDDWIIAAAVELDAKNPRMLTAKPGEGIIVTGSKGHARDLISKQKFSDVEVHVEFLIPKGSNSGVKLMGLYEIQIVDSAGKKDLTGDSCGGIYPRAEDQPKYHHIDKGFPPKVNAAKPAGEWQTFAIVFKAPRFDADGKKTANARFVKVVHNDQLVHENVEVAYPTGSAWRLKKEVASGPLLLQGDHGPVAFRNVKVRPLNADAK